MPLRAVLIQTSQQVEVVALLGSANALRAAGVENGRGARSESYRLVYGRQETRAPVDRSRRWLPLAAVEHYVRRQIRIGAAQRISHPGAERRASRPQIAGVHLQDRNIMRGAYSRAGLDEGDLVGMLGQIRQQIGEPRAALPVLFPCPLRRDE